MPRPSKIIVGKIEKITDKETKEIVFVHKVYIEYPFDKRLRYIKTYASTRMVRDTIKFSEYVQSLIDMDAEKLDDEKGNAQT